MRRDARRCAVAALALVAALGWTAGDAAAQDTTTPQADALMVLEGEKSAGKAAFLEWLVPTVGYAHAGNWSRGVPPALVTIGGLALYFEDQFQIFGNPPPCEAQCVTGLLLMVGSRFWAIIDAAAEANRFNERLRGLNVSITPDFGPNGVGIGLRLPLGN